MVITKVTSLLSRRYHPQRRQNFHQDMKAFRHWLSKWGFTLHRDVRQSYFCQYRISCLINLRSISLLFRFFDNDVAKYSFRQSFVKTNQEEQEISKRGVFASSFHGEFHWNLSCGNIKYFNGTKFISCQFVVSKSFYFNQTFPRHTLFLHFRLCAHKNFTTIRN